MVTVLLICLLSACAGMPISSMYKLRNFEPMDIDPQAVSIAVITHEAVQLADGSASLVLSYSSEVAEHNFSSHIVANLSRNPNIDSLQAARDDFEDITLFYLDEEAAKTLQIAQNRIHAIKQLNVEGDGSMSVNISSGCMAGSRPDSLSADIYVKFNNKLGYILINENVDLFAEALAAGQSEWWHECKNEKAV